MTPQTRSLFGWLPVVSLLAIVPAAWMATSANGEARKFVVLLADLPKERTGGAALPNRAEVYDAYFDVDKNGLLPGEPRVDSHAEWWEEVSYGDVTVSGNVYGWSSMPWPSRPGSGFDGNTSFQGQGRIPHIELQGGNTYDFGFGEDFDIILPKFLYDVDGQGANLFFGNLGPLDWEGFILGNLQLDSLGFPVWSPGERFLDLNNDRVYQAGVWEWGIDKNGNGFIDVDPPGTPEEQRRYNAASWQELLAANIDYPAEGEQDPPPPLFVSWDNETEWFDSNRDGQWNVDGIERPWVPPWPQYYRPGQAAGAVVFPSAGGDIVVTIWRGDWGSTEAWAGAVGQGQTTLTAAPVVAEVRGQAQDQPASFWEFLVGLFDPEGNNQQQTLFFDEQQNGVFDFPEPFEDYMRRWNPAAHNWSRMDNPAGEQYIIDNFPGDPQTLIDRTGNGRYNAPDGWNNVNSVNNSNKLQEIVPLLQSAAEAGQQTFRGTKISLEPDWLGEFWADRYGTEAPTWSEQIPYLRKFDPAQPRPRRAVDSQDIFPDFVPNGGGPFNNGLRFDGNRYVRTDGTVTPNTSDGEDGLYDGFIEFDDLPSSIYHAAGDQDFGEVTGPALNETWGEDVAAPSTDGLITAAGPLAFNVHGDGGFDAGNVLTTEYLTWRTDGRSLADLQVDFDGDGTPEFIQYHRDVNLDGLIDCGETVGDRGVFGIPKQVVYDNYGVDPIPGTPPNGGPSSEYPWNRMRLLEDMVEAVDEAVDWDDFLGGPDAPGRPPGLFGNVISGVILCPETTAIGMFALPAPTFDYGIRTRDQIDPSGFGRDRYVPINFFNGLGIGLNDGAGEGDSFDVGNFHTPFSAHEYGHSWEGYPDLYDYDVYRTNFTGRIINNPIAAWCVMAGGGLVHPVPILKVDSGWLTPVDITQVLTPAGTTTVEFKAWEFDRFRSVFVYRNPLFPGEEFWLWRNSPGVRLPGGGFSRLSFDRFQPGEGLVIMHVDRTANPEGLPLQQRLESHFTYALVQADGLQQLESGQNGGDAGDVWPGATGNVRWDRNSDPNNRWYSGQGSGLDITNIVTQPNSSLVTFRWTPRELPIFTWVQPPGGVSVNGIYQLRYFAYDQFGGTTIEFFAFQNQVGQPLSYDGGIPMGTTTKTPGEVDASFSANVSFLPDGTYTFFARLNPGFGADGNRENSWSVPRASINNRGTGNLNVNAVDPAISKLEVWTVTCVNATPGSETWSVRGSISGLQSTQATTGLPYTTDTIIGADNTPRNALAFTIFGGAIPYGVGDQFSFLTTGLTEHSAAVLINDGEVVTPVPPEAVATLESGNPAGLAPHSVVFRHNQSNDPGGATMTFSWNFGDGSPIFTTDQLDEPVPHTYTTPRPQPYIATLTVTNSFGLSTQDQISIQVNDPAPPTVRVNVVPTTGQQPLRVRFDASTTTDPNTGTQGLDYVIDFGDGSPAATLPSGAPVAEHVYDRAGIYRARLTVTNRPYNKSASTIIEIRVSGPPADQPPVATFDADVRFGPAPLKVRFNGQDSRDPEGSQLDFAWNFGDGSALVRGVNEVEHSFTRQGSFNVTLFVTDASGQTDSATLTIVVTGGAAGGNQAPVARIVSSTTQGAAPLTVTFDATSSTDPEGGPVSAAWDFGDGSPQATGLIVSHTYTQPRRYSIVLVVADSAGATGAATVDVQVNPASDGSSGQDQPTPDNPLAPEIAACGNGCGPLGFAPLGLTLLGIGGLKSMRRRRS